MTTYGKIRKAVIPVAGLGTRFLPITKSVPKEMLAIAGKPLIQYAVEEAAASGLETVILVVGKGKRLLSEYFRESPALEDLLIRRGREAEAEALRRLPQLADIRTVWQDFPHGLAHAIGCARLQVGDEPFAVILPDALIDSAVPCTRQLIECHERHQPGCVVATRLVDPCDVERFGILHVVPVHDPGFSGRVFRAISVTERPRPEQAKSRYGVFGRYILEPEIFDCIDRIGPGFGGELQLADALMRYSNQFPVLGFCFEGAHYDAGDKFGFLQASVEYALKDPAISDRLRRQLAAWDMSSVAVRTLNASIR
jgi:UTP--glucose-1-phosphate uridylyltransferase